MTIVCVEDGGIVDKIGSWRKAPWSRWPEIGAGVVQAISRHLFVIMLILLLVYMRL
jgi:hypothetical protein